MVAGARDDMRRCRVALEELSVTFAELLSGAPAHAPADPPPASSGTVGRPAVALAMALVQYLQAGGRLEPDLALDLSQELAASRARRRRD